MLTGQLLSPLITAVAFRWAFTLSLVAHASPGLCAGVCSQVHPADAQHVVLRVTAAHHAAFLLRIFCSDS